MVMTMADRVTSVPLVQKKTLAKMGSSFVETVAQGPSEFALRQLKKFGWKEGDGLGKNLQGRSERILVKKKVDGSGIGMSRSDAEAAAAQWWNDAFKNAAKSINVPGSSSSGDGSSSSSSSDDSDSDSDDDSEDEAVRASLSRDLSTYTEEDIALFRACKGRRCGKRAGRLQTGKMKREQEADRKFLEKWGGAKTSTSGDDTEALKRAMNESILVEAAARKKKEKKEKRKKEKKKKKKLKEDAAAVEGTEKKSVKDKKKSKKVKKSKKRKRDAEIEVAQKVAKKKKKKKNKKKKSASK